MSEVIKANRIASQSRHYSRIDWFWNENDPYQWQKNWWAAGKEHMLRHNSSANRQGKTFADCYEVALHALGWYPDWWTGKRFQCPTTGIVAGETTEAVRDTIQKTLLGDIGDFGSGWLPKGNIQNVVSRHGGAGAADYITVKRRDLSGGVSNIYLKSYDQGQQKIAGTEAHYFKYDENCPLIYFSEAIRALATTAGIVFGSYTPLEYSDLVSHLERMNEKDPGSVYLIYVDFDEARHLDEKTKAVLRSAWAPWELQARTTGHANRFGSGLVYPIDEDKVIIPPMFIPDQWVRLVSLDFGMSADPTAAVFRAIDKTTDTTYIYKTYKSKSGDSERQVVTDLWKEIRGLPVAWPLDGNKQIKGIATVEIYRRLGLKMVAQHAQFINGSVKVADGVASIRNRIEAGKIKVFSTCREWIEERRKYMYDDKGIARRQDDHIMDADRYGHMMERYAKPYRDIAFGEPERSNSTDYEVFEHA